MALTLEAALARVPQWVGVKDIKTTPLDGGITNKNFRIDVGADSFVLRIPGADTELLGINRENEYAANLIAGELGIAPKVFYFIRPEEYLVTYFIKGRPIPPGEISQPKYIQRVAELLHRVHSMPDIPGIFDVFRVVQEYTDIALRFKVPFPQEFGWLIERMNAAEKALKSHPGKFHPCHNDLLNANFLLDGQIFLLDWEYAAMGDLFFDLANFSDHHNLSEEQDLWLLKCYFEEVSASQWAHFKIMKILSDLHEAAWGLVQIGISQLDFDFRSYADKFFGNILEKIQNPEWNEWLKEVSRNV
jgi:thiamine kinase-like enzyme